MKKFALILCALALVATLTLSGCGEAAGGGDGPIITGTWKRLNDNKTLTINADKTFSGSYGSGTYTYEQGLGASVESERGFIVFSKFNGDTNKEFETIYGNLPTVGYRTLVLVDDGDFSTYSFKEE